MAVTSRDLHRPAARKPSAASVVWPRITLGQQETQLVVLAVLCAMALHLTLGRGQTWLDDLRYGRPRTTQLSAYVGLGEQAGQPTHIIGMNLNRRVTVIVLPGGDSSKAQTLQGPYLFGANEHLTPIGLRTQNVNEDAHDDLVITVKNEEIIYINTGETFRLISDEERQQVLEAR